jgi:iron complex outermembrane receptor protein
MSFRNAALFAAAMLVASVSATGVLAQSQASNQGQAAAEGPQVIVTGSHIPRPNLEQPMPVAVVTPQLIENSGSADLGQVISQLPSMGVQGSVRANSNSFGNLGGLSFADLRNLGVSRTLTLVDGDRHVSADPSSLAVDLGSIPPALVDHVEVVTGGTSAVYGSDAIAGVVNVILKKKFVGVEGSVQYGAYPDGGYGNNESGYLTVGRNFAHDTVNLNATLFWDSSAQILANQVPGLHNYGIIVNPIYESTLVPLAVNGVPQFIVAPNVESQFINNLGVLVDGTTDVPFDTFTKNGTPIPQQQFINANSFTFGQFEPNCATCFRSEDYELIQPKTDRVGGDVRLSYDILPNLTFSLDEKLLQREVYDFDQPSSSFFSFTLSPDNAFITPAIASALNAENPGALQSGNILVDRFLGDGGARATFARRITERVVPKLDGDFDAKFADIHFDAGFNFGETLNYLSNRNILIPGNFAAAEDSVIDPATGQPACRVNVPSAGLNPFTGQGATNPPPGMVGNPSACVPYNPFGLQNSKSALAYVQTTEEEYQRLTQEVATLNLSFDTSRFLNLPGGPIAIALGGEWRKESVVDNQDPLVSAGLTEVAATPNFSGGFESTEGYVEANFPLLKDLPFIKELSVDVADRDAQYTTVGNVNTWQVHGEWKPVSDIMFRADYADAIRAPNLTEAFLPPSGTFFSLNDPCDNEFIDQNPNRIKNCAALLGALGLTAGSFTDTAVNLTPPGIESGNSKLTPEESKSYTLGIVFQPHFFRNFSLTVDYYNIDIKNAIVLPTAQDIANNCVDGPSLDPAFCNLIQRAPNDGFVNAEGQIDAKGDISFVTDTYLNASRLFTDGIEVQSTYGFWVDPLHFQWSDHSDLPGHVTLSVDFNFLMHLHDFEFQTSPNQYIVEEGTGVDGTPYDRGRFDINYSQGPWSIDWVVRYVGPTADFNRNPGQLVYAGNAISPAYFPPEVYDDIIVHYRFDRFGGKIDMYAGANDIFNAAPPPNAITGNNGGPDGSALYDLGVYVFGGVRFRY